MSNLVEFLNARLDEDERIALAAKGQWVDAESSREGLTHLQRHGPARVLAECEAKRRIVEAYRELRGIRDAFQSDEAMAAENDEQATRRRGAAARCRGLEIAVELLALPYADHPDYDPNWAIE